MANIYNCEVIDLNKTKERVGNITSVDSIERLPFEIKRVYYIYDVPGGSDRGGHAHKELEQFVIAVSGAFDILLDDGKNKKIVRLDRPFNALHIRKGIWRETRNFTSGSICMVIASQEYNESDYIHTYEEFCEFKRNEQKK